ncbi:MAG: hypothetical protein JSS83_15295 [Cyanobacteria bacterium SZAS LIN-3]|nr:hypothetical protein [Cyanobacteria bacterium SZAS LIN-3]
MSMNRVPQPKPRWIGLAAISLFFLLWGVLWLLGVHPFERLIGTLSDFVNDPVSFVPRRLAALVLIASSLAAFVYTVHRMYSTLSEAQGGHQ